MTLDLKQLKVRKISWLAHEQKLPLKHIQFNEVQTDEDSRWRKPAVAHLNLYFIPQLDSTCRHVLGFIRTVTGFKSNTFRVET